MEIHKSSCDQYSLTDENIHKCARKILEGEVVIFPTETVYGIGASSMNPVAIKQLYSIKHRPMNNPLIMHVLNWRAAKIYTNTTTSEENIILELTKQFWPGPLTILTKKSKYVSDIVSGGTDWVSIRCPSNSIARKLLEYSMVPIVAPSANISGKITSTYKDHIQKYFDNAHVSMLVDPEPCTIGIESTILKIDGNNISIVRPGIITMANIKSCLCDTTFNKLQYTMCAISEQVEHPGSNISHYSTDKKTMLFNFIDTQFAKEANVDSAITESLGKSIDYYLTQCACIDFNNKNFHCRDKFGAYVDLSENGSVEEALFNLYNVLHQLNNTPVANILIFDFWSDKDGLYNTMFDRLFRCCNGQKIVIPIS
tara:strand:- start:545 stop:1651 length:1107 start_codon:yes stop_codon:yes gene_type:complete